MPRIAIVATGTPFSERLPRAFGYPLRGAALASCVGLALLHYVGLLPSFVGFFASLMVWAATWHYAADCMLHTAHGYADPPDVSLGGNESAGWALIAIHLLIVALCVVAIVFFPKALWPVLILSALALPAIDMSLAFDGNLAAALNPAHTWRIVTGFGTAYLIPVAINLLIGLLIALASLATGFLPKLLALPLYAFAYTYLIILGFHLMGAMIHERHERFGMAPEAEALARENHQDADEQLLEAVREESTRDPQMAIAMLVARMQDRSAPTPLHQAYRQLLRQQGLRDGLLTHGQIWIAALLANNEPKRALGLLQECIDIDPAFLPDDPNNTGTLAELATRLGMSRLAVKLCRGYLSTWPSSPAVPHYGLLAARQLGTQLEQSAEALVLLGKLTAAWPEHALHAEMLSLKQQLQDTRTSR
ncbi:hypothetical protein SAMN05216570_1695 [Dyella sp. OK004]|uniref:hypothetical protein n=1 Tax=Dyella sp. OK004 TaxID=1855292 RepID=UPI0008EE6B77|nr:hypothetical protein [Dyella sp. OK004]SFS03236.1 hypothetical protein SAMN05216570_1695 [Dyella sp. OK004]